MFVYMYIGAAHGAVGIDNISIFSKVWIQFQICSHQTFRNSAACKRIYKFVYIHVYIHMYMHVYIFVSYNVLLMGVPRGLRWVEFNLRRSAWRSAAPYLPVCVFCIAMQFVAVCYSVLQCVAVCCRVLQCIAVRCSASQCVAVCCSALRIVAARCFCPFDTT